MAYILGLRGFTLKAVALIVAALGLSGFSAYPQISTNSGYSPVTVRPSAAAMPGNTSRLVTNPAPLGGRLTPTPLGGTLLPAPVGGYFTPNPLSGQIGPSPLGGVLQPSSLGGINVGPSGGRLNGLIIGGAAPAGFSGGALAAHPGGQLSGAPLGGVLSPTNTYPTGRRTLIVSGPAPVSTQGGILVSGPPPMTSAPGGAMTNSAGGQLR